MSIFLVTIWLLRAPSSEVVRVSRSILLVWHGEPVLDIDNYSHFRFRSELYGCCINTRKLLTRTSVRIMIHQ